MKILIITLSIVSILSFPAPSFSENCNVQLSQGVGISKLNETLKCLNDEISKLKKSLEESRAFTQKEIPVGTVIASMLKSDLFFKTANDPIVFDSKKSKWAPADKRNVVGSKYSEKVGPNVPDLRGMFLRGVNLDRSDGLQDPDVNRSVGVPQKDSIQRHVHSFNLPHTQDQLAYWLIGHSGSGSGEPTRPHTLDNKPNINIIGEPINPSGVQVGSISEVRVSTETRPKNISVYYYIRIN